MTLTLAALKTSVSAFTHAVAPWTESGVAQRPVDTKPAIANREDAYPTIVSLDARRSYHAAFGVAPAGGGATETRFGRNSKQMQELKRQQTVFIGAVTSDSTAVPSLLGITFNGNTVSGYLIIKRADSETAGPVTGVKEGRRLVLHATLGAEQEKVDLLLDYGPLHVRGAFTRGSAPDQAETIQFRRAS